ncbi:WAT1-related protein At2g37460-like isoform X1 [Juglans microcarpa x Juglans regia]|uniref:WAT1-related protein At2g37460-like isoform X1 n=2 Tax=Juglans microcarpa x Juglans regia TaxID=2249226 RepID=UPI001B7EB73B|nr:WAT1-related protein At2g37460-like isoform X1 [Juglans microcarpa x Juglans regia]
MNIQAHSTFERIKPFLAVIFLQFGFAGMDVLSKAALNQGMSNYVLVVYRHVVAFVVIAPFAVFLDKKVRPKMTLAIFTKLIALSLLEPVIDQNLYFLGMKYTTATFAAAMTNILPALTFIMACILRLEVLRFKSIRSQAKVVGTIATVAGAMVMTLVKGPIIELMWTKGKSGQQQQSGGTNLQHSIKGSIMITIGCCSWACFMVLQAITLKAYPAELSLTAWICLLGSLEGTVVALVMEKGNTATWSINWNVKLLAALYSGVICSGLTYYIQGVIMKDRGPVFVTAFSPLCMVIVAVMGSFVLAEQMYLGRILGAIIIVVGLYLVVWGKSKDYKLSSTPSSKEQTAVPEKKIIINADSSGKENFNPEVVAIDVSGYGGEIGNTDGHERDGQRNLSSV